MNVKVGEAMEAKRKQKFGMFLLIPIWWLAIAMRDPGDHIGAREGSENNPNRHMASFLIDCFASDKNGQIRRFDDQTWYKLLISRRGNSSPPEL